MNVVHDARSHASLFRHRVGNEVNVQVMLEALLYLWGDPPILSLDNPIRTDAHPPAGQTSSRTSSGREFPV